MNTTELSEQLPALLDELACSSPIDDDDTTFVPHATLLAGDAHDARRPRTLAAVAAAGLLIIGAGALTMMRSGGDTTTPTPAAATPPPQPERTEPAAPVLEPSLFPAIDDPPPGLDIVARTESIPESSLWTEALIGRVDGSSISDTVTITVQADPFEISPMDGHPPSSADVFGQPATVYDYGVQVVSPIVHVTWGTGPYFLASGADPIAFLDTATSDSFTATNPGTEPPDLSIGQLPDGYEVIVAPNVVGRATTSVTLSIGADNFDVSVSTRHPVAAMSQVAPLRTIEVNGKPGWMFDTSAAMISQDVAWQVDDTTYAYLKVNDGSDATEALDLAERINFVDRETWTAGYRPVQDDVSTVTDPVPTADISVSAAPVDTIEPVGQETGDCVLSEGCETYVVGAGDFPAGVAEKFCITVDELVAANNWTDPADFPFPGVTIQIHDDRSSCPPL